jgi:polysaccharide biosynthesis transport protein
MQSYPGAGNRNSQEGLALHEYLNILRRQKWVIGGCLLVSLGAGYLLSPKQERSYEASALIRVDEKQASLPRIDERGLLPTGNQVATEMQILRSRSVASAVVDSLRLQVRVREAAGAELDDLFQEVRVSDSIGSGNYHFSRRPDGRFVVDDASSQARLGAFGPGDPIQLPGIQLSLSESSTAIPEFTIETYSRERAVESLLSRVNVRQPDRNASIIRVQFQSSDPHRARDVVNILTRQFLALRSESQTTESSGKIAFLRGQLDTLSIQLAVAEDELRSFRETARVIDPITESRTQVQRLAELQAERTSMEAERSALARLVAEIQASGAAQHQGGSSPYRRLASFPPLMRSSSTTDLLRTLATIENERATLLMRRNLSDPDVRILTARISDLEDQLRGMVTMYLDGLTSQVTSLDGSLAQFQSQLGRIPQNEVQFARFSRNAEMLAGLHALLQNRLKEAEVAQAGTDASVRVVDLAVLPAKPIRSISDRLFLAGSFIFGLLFGIAAGFIREYRDPSVHSRADMQAAVGMPVLGLIPNLRQASTAGRISRLFRLGARGGKLPKSVYKRLPASSTEPSASSSAVTAQQPALGGRGAFSPASDAYLRLNTNIGFATPGREPKTLLVTSALPGDGKTTTATNLALTLALQGLKVLLIDGDLRRGAIHSVLRTTNSPGLAEVLLGTAELQASIRTVAIDQARRLHFLPRGTLPPYHEQMLGASRMKAVIEELERKFDRIIIDSPPVNIVPDAVLLAQYGDGVIVVARAGVTPFEALVYTAEQLRHVDAPVLGTVLNDIDFAREATYDAAYRSYEYARAYYSSEARV